MTADEIVTAIEYHIRELDILRRALPQQCAIEGHKWDNPVGELDTICVREGIWVEADPESIPRFGSRGGHWAVQPKHEEVYRRVCKRCGYIEKRRPLVTKSSPFTERG